MFGRVCVCVRVACGLINLFTCRTDTYSLLTSANLLRRRPPTLPLPPFPPFSPAPCPPRSEEQHEALFVLLEGEGGKRQPDAKVLPAAAGGCNLL